MRNLPMLVLVIDSLIGVLTFSVCTNIASSARGSAYEAIIVRWEKGILEPPPSPKIINKATWKQVDWD